MQVEEFGTVNDGEAEFPDKGDMGEERVGGRGAFGERGVNSDATPEIGEEGIMPCLVNTNAC